MSKYNVDGRFIQRTRMRVFVSVLMSVMLLMLLSACSDESQQQAMPDNAQMASPEVTLKQDAARYTRGLKLYQQTCAECHGKQGEGAPGWQQRGKDGKFLPPPLNGTGHTWHHPMNVLLDIINNGTQRLGGDMPAWKDKLSNEQIQDILFWIQSQWDKEIYAAWYRNNQAVDFNSSKN